MWSHLSKVEQAPVRYLLAWVLLLVFVKQLAWLMVLPLWQTPDETAHFHYVQYLAETGKLPKFSRDLPLNHASEEASRSETFSGLGFVAYRPKAQAMFSDSDLGPEEASLFPPTASGRLNDGNSTAAVYPPAYYGLGALAYRFAYAGSVVDRVFAVRTIGILFTLVTVAAAFFLAFRIWASPLLAAAFALIVGFHPMLSMLGVSVNNDAMLIALASVAITMLVHHWSAGYSLGRGVALGAVFGLGMLSKPQMVYFGLAAGVLLVSDCLLRRKPRMVPYLLATGATTIALYGPWLLYCKQVYGTYMPSLIGSAGQQEIALATYVEHYLFGHGLSRFYELWVVMYWADFGWLDTIMAEPTYRILAGGMLVGLAGAVAMLWQRGQPGKVLVLASLGTSLGFLAFLYAAEYQVLRQTGLLVLQGRYWLPAILPTTFVFVQGWLTLAPTRMRHGTALVLVIASLLFNMACWLRVIERYYV